MPSPIHHLLKTKSPFLAKVPTLRERLLEYGKANKWPHIGFGGAWPSGNVRYAIGADTENMADRRMLWTTQVAACSEIGESGMITFKAWLEEHKTEFPELYTTLSTDWLWNSTRGRTVNTYVNLIVHSTHRLDLVDSMRQAYDLWQQARHQKDTEERTYPSSINDCLTHLEQKHRQLQWYASQFALHTYDGCATHQTRKMALKRIEEMRNWLNNLEEDIREEG